MFCYAVYLTGIDLDRQRAADGTAVLCRRAGGVADRVVALPADTQARPRATAFARFSATTGSALPCSPASSPTTACGCTGCRGGRSEGRAGAAAAATRLAAGARCGDAGADTRQLSRCRLAGRAPVLRASAQSFLAAARRAARLAAGGAAVLAPACRAARASGRPVGHHRALCSRGQRRRRDPPRGARRNRAGDSAARRSSRWSASTGRRPPGRRRYGATQATSSACCLRPVPPTHGRSPTSLPPGARR